ncbi:trihelix transcription factor DF1-like isoform X2 [Mangifera indica]|uniref:trihelix transcription factor DF1-like isoform X2 n=1 Tax=Mangifera indica TaxID=29780 RepID=UPI001CFB39F6|nr:trihelix transcription factor DF1-like isoform X2 [Mangifera indica]
MLAAQDSSGVLGNSPGTHVADLIGDHVTSAAAAVDAGSNSGGEDDKGDRSFGGNRWPRQETLALLKIRSDMDQVFRDSSHKGPLWEEVSRKLVELGYHRSAKKCKEKFENVYKYHKRTKDGRTGKPEGKHYKFFYQLEALHHHHPPLPKPQTTPFQPVISSPSATAMPLSTTSTNPIAQNTTQNVTSTLPSHAFNSFPSSFPNISSHLFSSSTSSSTASEEQYSEEVMKRKRKWKKFFKRLTKQVIKKQEELQDKFLETIERRENERLAREEAWRIQEMTRINREHEILIQERSTAAAKDTAVIAFLQKISGQQQNLIQSQEKNNPPQPPAPPPLEPSVRPQQQRQEAPHPPPSTTMMINLDTTIMSRSSRWPKAEVQALIKFRTAFANRYQENGQKGPLWEDISVAMRSMGYDRSAKRCKEKWENINKYFKKVKESNKERSENSKTCPYFTQLDALYREKIMKPVNNPMVPLMVQPEQQWPLMQEDENNSNAGQVQDDEEGEDLDTEDYEYESGGGSYEIAANKAAAASPIGSGE